MGYISQKAVIIDSGIGGLTVVNHLLALKSNADITYCADNRFFPYGIKTDVELISILKRLLDYFLENKYAPIIIACNTASRIFNTYLKSQYQDNIYSIIESTITCIEKYQEAKRILIIGTKNTIHSKIYETEIKKKYNIQVVSKACSRLVELCENNEQTLIINYLKKNLSCFKTNIDTILLGCTHFNILGDTLSEFFNHKVNIIYSGYSLIDLFKHSLPDRISHKLIIYLTKHDESYGDRINKLFTELKNYEIKVLNI